MNASELLREMRIQVIGQPETPTRIFVQGSEYGIGWLVLYNAAMHLQASEEDCMERSTFYRQRFGSSAKAALFPQFKQKQIEVIKGE